MTSRTDELLDHIAGLERDLEAELSRAREQYRYQVHAGRVRFEREVHQAQERLKQSVPSFLRESSLRNVLSAPAIYSLIVPIALLDLWITAYQAIAFRLYRISLVRRSDYILMDRNHLAYLNVIEKLNCSYCAYANGVFAYVREVGARTEQYWCPIRHAKKVCAPHAHYRQFIDFGDADGYRRRLIPLRDELKNKH